MHTLFDNMTDAEFVRWLERPLTDARKDQIVARLEHMVHGNPGSSEYQRGFAAGRRSTGRHYD